MFKLPVPYNMVCISLHVDIVCMDKHVPCIPILIEGVLNPEAYIEIKSNCSVFELK